jgi:hypothetical protein
LSGSGDTRTVVVTPAPNVTSASPITITLSLYDGFSTVTGSFTVTVSPVDDPPVALGGRFRGQSGFVLSNSVSGYDPEDDPLSFTAAAPTPAHGTLSLQTNGSFTFTPTPGFKGMDVFNYTVTANSLTSAAAQVFVTIAGDPNGTRPLIVSEPSDEQIAASGSFTYSVVVDTRRYVVAPTLSYELVGAPTGMTINSTTGVIPAWGVGTTDRHLSFGIVVKDALGALDTQTVVLRVVGSSASN